MDCEQFWLWRHTPVIHYDIVDERKGDYETDMGPDYFRQAASRTVEFCDRTSFKPETPLAAPRRIRGIWFQSNDGQFKILFDVDRGAVGASAGVTNRIGDRAAARRQADARHEAQLEEIRTREARAQEVRAAEAKAAQDKVAAENAREQLFFDRKDLQVSRLGTQVSPADFALVADVRTNPFHFKNLGLAVVRTQFNRMVSDRLALFGNELAPIFVHIADVDRFTRSGETVMLALKVVERGEVGAFLRIRARDHHVGSQGGTDLRRLRGRLHLPRRRLQPRLRRAAADLTSPASGRLGALVVVDLRDATIPDARSRVPADRPRST